MIQFCAMKNTLKIIIVFLLSINLYASDNLEKISLQLEWKYQFQYAGFIMAQEKGFYKDAGLKVTLLEYKDGVDIEDVVLSQKVDVGLSNTPLMIKDGLLQPTVLLATYLQRSPLVFVTQPEIKKPSQLNGKKIMATEYEYTNSSLTLLMEHFFVQGAYLPHSYGIEAFKNKKVDAISAFTSNQLYELDKQNIPYNIIDPYQYGFVTNAMNLFTSREFVKNNPKKVENFLKATKKGWQYALDNTDETVKIIHSKYNTNKSIEELTYEAKEIKNIMLLGLYDIGEISKELLIRAYKQLSRSGKLLADQKNKIVTFHDILKDIKSEKVDFTQEERDFLAKKGTLSLCVDTKWMPFEDIQDGKHVGMIAEYFDLIREKTNIQIEVHPTESWEESMRAIENRQCDIIGSASPVTSRFKFMNFTDPYMKSPMVLITKMDKLFVNDIEDVKQKKLGIIKGSAIAEILKSKYPDINIVDVANLEDGFKKVESGQLYGYIDNLNVTVFNIQKGYSGVLKVSARLNITDDLTIGSRNDEPLLNSIFQKIILSIDNSEVREILNRWVRVEETVQVDYTFLWQIFGGVCIVFLLFTAYSYQLKINNKKLEKLSRKDLLTQVGNRLKLNEVLENSYKFSQRYKNQYGVILLDIDDFKKVNDTYGHLVGDDVLKKFAQILMENIRQTDKPGRWGGEEFMIVCPNVNTENLKKIAEGLRKHIESDVFLKEKGITASFGLSIFDGMKDIEQVINEADKNLYKAKDSGKNRVYIS